MTATTEQRAAYLAAKAKLDAVEAQRAELLKPTDAAYLAAMEEQQLALEACGDLIGTCESCREPIFVGDRMLGGETPLCGTCAPTYAQLLNAGELSSFVQRGDDGDWMPMTAERARKIYDDHIAAGGKPEDSMAEVASS